MDAKTNKAFNQLKKRDVALIEFPALEIILSEGMAKKGIPYLFRQDGEVNLLTVHIAMEYFFSFPVAMENAERLIGLMKYFINRPDCAVKEWPGVRRFCDYRLAKKWDKVATSQNPQDAGGR